MPIVIDEDACDGCGNCVDECPTGAIELDDVARVDMDVCDECGLCIDVCPNDAIRFE